MLTTLKSGTTVHFSGIPLNLCMDVEVEVEEASVPRLSPEDATALNIPCTLRHPHPPTSVGTGTPPGLSQARATAG